ncbi:aromatic acid/H+ symport family MFS transporter [Variovorax defluvii]|uniref:Aromatic acid/H+ symport family MFS transporter n=1 Tax=Variovorax defluvii TaxID=913761 RepID=A0ABP8I9N3_9BURK
MHTLSHDSRVVDVDAAVDAAPVGRTLVLVMVLCSLVAFLDGFDTLAITYVAPEIARAWQLPKEAFGPIFAAHYVGAAMGAGLFGVLADRIGRRPAILAATATFGVFALTTPLCDGFVALLLVRGLTGLGLGGALSNVIALVSEYAPSRVRATMVSIMYAAFPLGGVIGGPLSAYVLAQHGWHAVFLIGGVAPLVLLGVLFFLLPESIRFLAAQRTRAHEIADRLRRLNPAGAFGHGDRFVVGEPAHRGKASVRVVLSGGHLRSSLLLGGASFITQMVIVYVITWMPTLLLASGLDLSQAILTSATFSLGGILGSLLLARIIDRVGAPWPLSAAFAASALALAAVGLAPGERIVLLAAVAQAGGLIVGAQVNLSAYCATVYPTDIRSTGLGWIIGLGRIGAICGALLGTAFVALGLTLPWQYGISGLAALCTALLVHMAGRRRRETAGVAAVETA